MRLKACLGIALLGSGGCTTFPDSVRVEAAGNTLEFRKKPVVPEAPAADAAEPEAPAPAAPEPEGAVPDEPAAHARRG